MRPTVSAHNGRAERDEEGEHRGVGTPGVRRCLSSRWRQRGSAHLLIHSSLPRTGAGASAFTGYQFGKTKLYGTHECIESDCTVLDLLDFCTH